MGGVGLPQLAMADDAWPEYAGPEAGAEIIRLPMGGDPMTEVRKRGDVDREIRKAQRHAWVAAGLGAVAFLLANVQVWFLIPAVH